jgi:hypothetical protein
MLAKAPLPTRPAGLTANRDSGKAAGIAAAEYVQSGKARAVETVCPLAALHATPTYAVGDTFVLASKLAPGFYKHA